MTLPYRCPRCRADVARDAAGYVCSDCAAHYPVVCGIPDFRIAPDPYIGLEEDRDKARRLDERARALDLAELVRFYFEITPEVPAALARSHSARILDTGPARALSCLALLEATHGPQPAERRVLEVGCGAGPFLPALASRFERVVGVDVALRWLVVARARLAAVGCGAELVCAGAEQLPFRDAGFDLVFAANVIEHVRDSRALLAESRRVLGVGGLLVLTTPNRTSLAPDPHVRVWGLGFLPRGLRDTVVRGVRRIPFEHVRTHSYRELRRLFSDAGFDGVRLLLPEVPALERSRLGPLGRLAAGLYNRLRTWPGVRGLFYAFGPFFQVIARAPSRPAAAGTAPARAHQSRSQASPAPRA